MSAKALSEGKADIRIQRRVVTVRIEISGRRVYMPQDPGTGLDRVKVCSIRAATVRFE